MMTIHSIEQGHKKLILQLTFAISELCEKLLISTDF